MQASWNIPVPNGQWKTPDDGQRNCPKHVDFLDINKFGKISASVGFIKRKMEQVAWFRREVDENCALLGMGS